MVLKISIENSKRVAGIAIELELHTLGDFTRGTTRGYLSEAQEWQFLWAEPFRSMSLV